MLREVNITENYGDKFKIAFSHVSHFITFYNLFADFESC